MHKRFIPALGETRRVLEGLQNRLQQSVGDADRHWIDALVAVFGHDLNPLTVSEVHSILLGIVTSGQGIPWNFYDTVSELIRQVQPFIKDTLIQDICIKTGYEFEQIRVTTDGHWQIVWTINPEAIDQVYREVVLDWYIPPEKDAAPLVPLSIIDQISSCVLLLRNKLILPAASALSVALETALWHELTTKNLLQPRQEITYAPVEWHFKRWHDQFHLKIEGSDKPVKDIPQDLLTGASLREVTFSLRKTHVENTDNTVNLQLRVNKNFVSYLASDKIAEVKDVGPGRGLSTAIERARKEKLACLTTIGPWYDQTLINLRNSLIHLPSNGVLKNPIPIPGDGEIQTTAELEAREEFIHHLLYLVSQVIRHIYKG